MGNKKNKDEKKSNYKVILYRLIIEVLSMVHEYRSGLPFPSLDNI